LKKQKIKRKKVSPRHSPRRHSPKPHSPRGTKEEVPPIKHLVFEEKPLKLDLQDLPSKERLRLEDEIKQKVEAHIRERMELEIQQLVALEVKKIMETPRGIEAFYSQTSERRVDEISKRDKKKKKKKKNKKKRISIAQMESSRQLGEGLNENLDDVKKVVEKQLEIDRKQIQEMREEKIRIELEKFAYTPATEDQTPSEQKVKRSSLKGILFGDNSNTSYTRKSKDNVSQDSYAIKRSSSENDMENKSKDVILPKVTKSTTEPMVILSTSHTPEPIRSERPPEKKKEGFFKRNRLKFKWENLLRL